jgi:tetratricopeptide (TPR) repeat protein
MMDQLLERIPPDVERDYCQRTAIEGLGGVGKTQMALEAAYRVRERDPHCSVFWVPAVDVTSFENAYREIGQRLQVPGIEEHGVDVKSLVKNAMNQDSYGRWLLIVDNVDDMELFFGPAALCDYLPSSPQGSILFTTRNHQAVVKLDIYLQNIITAAKMSDTEALKMLQTNLKDNQTSDRDSTTALLELLAHLPLAIKQASAYMAKMGMSTTKYLQHCRASDQKLIKLLSQETEYQGRYKGISNAVATTWLVSFTHISRDQPLAADILRWSCFLVEKDIPVSLFSQGEDELEVDEAMGTLKAYAFITERADSQSFDVHRLVQLAMRNWLRTEGQQQHWIGETIRRLADVFPFPKHENREVWRRCLPHALSVVSFHEHDFTEPVDIDLLFNIAGSFLLLGKYGEAGLTYQHTLDLRKKVLGEEHPDTLASMNNLAIVLQQQEKYKEAEKMHRQELGLTKKVLGKVHPDTLASMDNLANVLQQQEKYEEAEEMHRRTLDLMRMVLGEEHPSTLGSMNNLAIVLRQQEKYEEAEKMLRQALDLMRMVLGEEHPYTLASMGNLANVLQQQEKYEEAEEMHRQTLTLTKKVLGEEHPSTLDSMNNLAEALRQQEKYEEAEEMHRQTLTLTKKVLGEEHPSTLDSMNSLAEALQQQEKYEEAEEMLRQTLTLTKKVLGEEHPSTLDSMNSLAIVLRQQEKYEEAEQIFE